LFEESLIGLGRLKCVGFLSTLAFTFIFLVLRFFSA
jgi:hypothetical protein